MPVGVGGGVFLRRALEPPGILGPLLGHVHRDGHTLPGVGDGRGEELGEGLCTEPAVQLRPASGGSGDHGGNPALLGHLVKAQIPDQTGADGGRSHSAGVEAVELFFLLHPHQGKGIGAQTIAGGL